MIAQLLNQGFIAQPLNKRCPRITLQRKGRLCGSLGSESQGETCSEIEIASVENLFAKETYYRTSRRHLDLLLILLPEILQSVECLIRIQSAGSLRINRDYNSLISLWSAGQHHLVAILKNGTYPKEVREQCELVPLRQSTDNGCRIKVWLIAILAVKNKYLISRVIGLDSRRQNHPICPHVSELGTYQV